MNNNEEGNHINGDRSNRLERPDIFKLMFKPKALLSIILIYAGIGIPFLMKSQMGLSYFLEKFGPITLGVCLALPGLAMLAGEMSKAAKFKKEERFTDVDDNRDNEDKTFKNNILRELRTIKETSSNYSEKNIEEIVSKVI